MFFPADYYKGHNMTIFGARSRQAMELRVADWIDEHGKKRSPLKIDDLGEGYKIFFCFQDWCPGCHSHGFPTLKVLYDELFPQDVSFAAIQTVFEGADINTFEKTRLNQERYKLPIPFGHDVSENKTDYPSFMTDYQTGGTPWFVLIDPKNRVVFSDFQVDAQRLIAVLKREELDPY